MKYHDRKRMRASKLNSIRSFSPGKFQRGKSWPMREIQGQPFGGLDSNDRLI